MDIGRVLVIHGASGWDEATPAGPFVCYDVRPGKIERELRDSRDYGMETCSLDDLRGGDAQYNAARVKAALEGGDTDAHRDALVLGAALALEVTGHALDAHAGVSRAREALESGAGRALLGRLVAFGKERAA
jgi:anthranilate phosphoribosyltransferase